MHMTAVTVGSTVCGFFFFFKSVHYFSEFTRTLQGDGEKERSVKYIFLSIPAELDA